jgi:hypothetical protein
LNFKYIKQKYKNGLRLWILLAAGCGLGACAYDPAESVGSNGGEPQSKNSLDEIGSDLVVSERLVLKSYPEKIRRLTLLEGAVLATNGQALQLDVEEVVSFGGVIDTTPVDPTPAAGANGISGGLFHLTATRGRGNLSIVAGGQSGAVGLKGAVGEVGAKGGRGGNGANDYTTECWFSALALFERDPGGPGHCHKNWSCSRQTGDGAQGARGTIGKPGLAGGSGGDSAPILVELEDPSGLLVSTEAHPGKGGSGGQGGDGGIGGPGGDPGARDSRNICRVANRGPQGTRGDQGPLGLGGKDGNEQPICLRLGVAQIGNCRDFDDLMQ